MAAEEKLLAWPVKFKEPGSIIHVNGQQIHSGNLTEDSYLFLLSWNKDYALQFVPAEEKEAAKPKSKPDGKGNKDTTT